MHTRIARFGFELEMLDPGECDVGEAEYDCDCGSSCCSGSYTEEREWSDDARRLIELFGEEGLLTDTDQHDYHCGCRDCDPARQGALLAFQADCTVGAEFITRILRADDDDDREQIALVVDSLGEFYRRSAWKPDGWRTAGNHVHVSKSGDDDGRGLAFVASTRRAAMGLISAAYAVFDWEPVADGGCGRLRNYNYKPQKMAWPRTIEQVGDAGSWCIEKAETFEHRLWNTPVRPQRIWAHVGLSLALTRWAFANVLQNAQLREADIGSIYSTLERRRDAFVDEVGFYIPPGDEFTPAHVALANLA